MSGLCASSALCGCGLHTCMVMNMMAIYISERTIMGRRAVLS